MNTLFVECCSIQSHLPSHVSTAPTSGQVARCFADFIIQGKLRAASHLIEDNADSFPLSLDATVTISGQEASVKDALLKKHPLVNHQSHLRLFLHLLPLLLFIQ